MTKPISEKQRSLRIAAYEKAASAVERAAASSPDEIKANAVVAAHLKALAAQMAVRPERPKRAATARPKATTPPRHPLLRLPQGARDPLLEESGHVAR